MKKLTFYLAFMMVLGAVSMAQDTIVSGTPKDNYFYTDHNWIHGDSVINGGGLVFGDGSFDEMAVAYHTNHPLQLNGIAIMLEIRDKLRDSPGLLYQDTTMDGVYCDVRLYKCIVDSLYVIGECRVHLRDTPVSYMQEMTQTNMGSGPDPIVKPVYECLFDTPIIVVDSFYVGFAPNNGCNGLIYDSSMNQYVFPRRYSVAAPIFLGSRDIAILKDPITTAYRRTKCYNEAGVTPRSWKKEVRYRPDNYIFMYAIVDTTVTPADSMVTPIDTTVPPVDTTVTPVDTTTTGVSRVDMVGRYVSVSPNPAGDRATVLSSFGLTRIEVYDPQGRQIYAAPATGLRTTLDVSTWPRGTALLHIHTPAGTTVKKLLLR